MFYAPNISLWKEYIQYCVLFTIRSSYLIVFNQYQSYTSYLILISTKESWGLSEHNLPHYQRFATKNNQSSFLFTTFLLFCTVWYSSQVTAWGFFCFFPSQRCKDLYPLFQMYLNQELWWNSVFTSNHGSAIEFVCKVSSRLFKVSYNEFSLNSIK